MIPQGNGNNNPVWERPDKRAYSISNLQDDFDHIIRNCNMFGKDFYDMIHVYHREVCDKAVPKDIPEE